MIRREIVVALALAPALGSLLGCGSLPRNPAAERAGRAAEAVMVLPLNVVMTLPGELEASSDRAWEALVAYVEAHGKRVQTVTLRDARIAWRGSIAVVASREETSGSGFDEAARVLALTLREEHAFDALIIPSLFVQTARMSGRSASWDGVRRQLEIEGDVRRIGSVVTSISFRGGAPAASLHAVVLDEAGNTLLQGQGGLELLATIQVHGKAGAAVRERAWTFEPRQDLFADPEHLREGIAVALDPFLPPLPAEGQ